MARRVIIHNHLPKQRKRVVPAKDASPSEIEKEYQQLRTSSKEYLAKQVAGRLDPSLAMSAPKGDLISQILNDKFSRKDLDAWGK